MKCKTAIITIILAIVILCSLRAESTKAADICLLFDGSSSFRHLEASKRAGINIVKELIPGEDSVTIIVFDNKPRLLYNSFLNTDGDVRAAMSVIDGIRPGHLEKITNIETAWNFAAGYFTFTNSPEDRVLIFSDLIHDYSEPVSLKKIPDSIPVTALYISPVMPIGYDYARKEFSHNNRGGMIINITDCGIGWNQVH